MGGRYVPVAETTRGGLVESTHFGLAVVADPAGAIDAAWGDPAAPVILRSAGKPFQAAQAVASGLVDACGVTALELAVVVGSHGGAREHVAAVGALMARTGVTEEMLRCGIHPPFDPQARLLARRTGATVLQNNCSGKHAAMLAGALHHGWPTESYLDPEHPWQRAIRALLAAAGGLDAAAIGTVPDGCSAPSFVLPAAAAARAYAALAAAGEPALSRVWEASCRHPEMVAGTGRLETDLMLAAPGRILAKSGAEGVYALAVRTGSGPRGVVIKIADGDDRRARPAVAIALASRWLGLDPAAEARLRQDHVPEVHTLAGLAVGEVRSLIPAPS